MEDRYGNPISTGSAEAADAYCRGVDLFLSANHGAVDAFGQAVAHDPGFALAHAALARAHQAVGEVAEAREAIKGAVPLREAALPREAAHIDIMEHLIGGRGTQALDAIREHAKDHPRDAIAVQPAMGVFGLIGFSGLAGREQATLDFTTSLLPHYDGDWWFLAQHAFSQMETGDRTGAESNIERAMDMNPRNANGAHYRSHLYYENGQATDGYAYLDLWRQDYDPRGVLACHIAWHVALWALADGDTEKMWRVLDADIAPGGAWGPALNVLTDTAALLYRAEIAGVEVPAERWGQISRYASEHFPKPGVAFGDVHAALAHAMAGNDAALREIIEGASGPAGDVVRAFAEGFGAIAAQDWPRAAAHLEVAMKDHARIGGSRAQRDLVEYALANVLMRQGRAEEAEARLRRLRGETVLGIDVRAH